jgi:hypothetical protein
MLRTQLEKSCEAFRDCLQDHLDLSIHDDDRILAKAEVRFFMYFDEAHLLTKTTGDLTPLRSKYYLLGRVLAKMNEQPFFAVFLLTNSWLGAFAPSTYRMPSLRDWPNVVLHAPFTELPFDTFTDYGSSPLWGANPKGIWLRDMCNLEYIVQFGRPL